MTLSLVSTNSIKMKKKREYTLVDIAHLSIAFNKSAQTINRWIKTGNDILTSDKAKKALSKVKK